MKQAQIIIIVAELKAENFIDYDCRAKILFRKTIICQNSSHYLNMINHICINSKFKPLFTIDLTYISVLNFASLILKD
jgi:hypothetical protein